MDNNLRDIQDMLYKIFRDDRSKYFTSGDEYKQLAGDNTFLSYSYYRNDKTKVIISIGGDDISTTELKICYSIFLRIT
jgi:hypothetical protein